MAKVQCDKNNDKTEDLPSLDSVLNKEGWSAEQKAWYESCNSLRILAVGRSGVGKSTFINAMYGDDVAHVAAERSPTTSIVKAHDQEVQGVKLTFYDSPGLQDGQGSDRAYIKDMKDTCKVVSLLLYCVRMDDQVREHDYKTMKIVTSAFGKDIWKNVMFVLTQANNVKPVSRSQGSPTDYFNRIFNAMKQTIQGYVKKEFGVTVPVVASGSPIDFSLPVCDDWRNMVLHKSLDTCSNEGAVAILKSKWGQFTNEASHKAGKSAALAKASLKFGPPGWVAGVGLISFAGASAIAGKIGKVVSDKYTKKLIEDEKVKGPKKKY